MSIIRNPINLSGKELENAMQNFLIEHGYNHTRNYSSGIDFIINCTNGYRFYVECKNQQQGGSVMEKIPHTIFKYKIEYNMKELFIIQPYRENMGDIMKHIKMLEKTLDLQVYIDDFHVICRKILNNTNPNMASSNNAFFDFDGC